MPSNLKYLTEALPTYHRYTDDMVIEHHTLFPLYAPFLSFERAHTLRQQMKINDKNAHTYVIAGLTGSKVLRPQWLKYCSECVKADRLLYGECYWHRVHQVPGVFVCPVHEIILENSHVNTVLGSNIVQYCSAEQAVHASSGRVIPRPLHTALLQLAKNAEWLLEHLISVEDGYIKKQYLKILSERGFSTATGRLRYDKTKDTILKYYPAQMLEMLECDIAQSRINWLWKWITMQHPLHHLLFIQFLCETSQEFFSQPQYFTTPFGHGPWPCLNQLCCHYKDPVIKSYTLKQRHINESVATFACSCGFIYSRARQDDVSDDIFRVGKIVQFGNFWDERLIKLWQDQNISTRQLAQLMHTNVKTVRRQAARLGLPFSPDIPRRGKRPRIYQDCIDEQRDSRRTLWEETLKIHPNATITKIMKEFSGLYWWLDLHDRDWLNEHLPAKNHPSHNKRLALSKMQLRRDHCSLVDADLAKTIRKTSIEIHSSFDFPIQVTRQLLIAKIDSNESSLLRSKAALKFLPLTRNALSETIEGYTAFIWRKLKWTVENYLTEQISPSYRVFVRKARIGVNTLHKTVVKQLVQIAYDSLKVGTLLSNLMPEMDTELREIASYEEENAVDGSFGSMSVYWYQETGQVDKIK